MSRWKWAGVAWCVVLLSAPSARGQHLWWDLRGQEHATCLYGEITVLATHPGIYYCGANWHPGEPAGGYCGIQHNRPAERRTIFSIWDTTPRLHPRVTKADAKTIFNRFGGEGEGAHTHMIWDWKVGERFRFVVRKAPGRTAGTTDATYFAYDRAGKTWRQIATISCPNGDVKSRRSVATVGGGSLVSFLENFTGRDREVPKLAIYRLWLGTSRDSMTSLTRATGDGIWGKLGDAYFLAEGNDEKLKELLERIGAAHGPPAIGKKGKHPGRLARRKLPSDVLELLPPADAGSRGADNGK